VRVVTASELMDRYIAAMRSGDWETGFGFYADDIVLHVPGRSALAGTHRGRDAAVRYIQSAIGLAHDVDVELVDMLAGGDHVALLVRERFTADGGTVEIRRANVYRVCDGKIAELRIFEADQYAVDALLTAGS
jgi:ketosteroid isomerase-like protein